MRAHQRGKRRILEGWVVSDKMQKSRVVAIRWSKRHPFYAKVRKVTTKVMAHDEKNETRAGDRVRVMESRPFSSSKRWVIKGILGQAK